MNNSVFWLLVTPLFFAFGWIAGRIDMKTVIKQAKLIPNRVFATLDLLLEKKTANACDNISNIVDQEPQLIELQLVLGRLYRSRGENDLAIKLHTRMLNSQFIFSDNDYDNIRLELAKDYKQAGLVDRSESLLLKLVNSNLYSEIAAVLLLDIYQQDKNWKDAIQTAKKLATSDYSYHTELAQFNCEIAQEAIIKSNNELALIHLNNALEINKKCVRANIIFGDILFANGEYIQAIETWQLIEKQNYLFIPLVIDKLFDAYLNLNQIKQGLILLTGYATLYPILNIVESISKKLRMYDSKEAAFEYLKATIRVNPTSKVASLMIDSYLNQNKLNESERSEVLIIKDILIHYDEILSVYKCGRCNFKAKSFFWQCPACYEWESINPNNIEN